MWPFSITVIHSEKLYMSTTFKDVIPDGTKLIRNVPPDDILEILTKRRTRESDQLKPQWHRTNKILDKNHS